MEPAQILVVDDKENMLRLFGKILAPMYRVTTASSGTGALELVASRTFDLVVTDIRMPGADGFEVLRAVKKAAPLTEVIMMTAYASVAKAVEAIKHGAYDYLQKPFDPDDVSLVVARALENKRLNERSRQPMTPVSSATEFEELIGQAPTMLAVYTLLEQVAAVETTVLLTGESGTGKELAARAVHRRSARASRPFVAVNCGALPGDLIESELFGHGRGAFTGAGPARVGLFEAAQGGTLFLDEIGDLPLAAQVKLTRVLQEGEVRRVGESRAFHVDVRVIAATHRDLKAEVQAGRFREDLFYRLHVFPIRLPPLRERSEDIPLLAGYFLERYGRLFHRVVEGFEPEAMRALTGYSWPGNVRELENAVERSLAIAPGPVVPVMALPPDVRSTQEGPPPLGLLLQMPYKDAVDLARDRAARDYLVALVREFHGNITRAAERAGMERESLHRLLKRYRVRPEDYRG